MFFYDSLFLAPTLPGRSRIVIVNGPIFLPLLTLLPPWFYHLAMHDVLDGEIFIIEALDGEIIHDVLDGALIMSVWWCMICWMVHLLFQGDSVWKCRICN